MTFEYKTEQFVRQDEINEATNAGWRIKQTGNYVDLMGGWDYNKVDMGYEWVLYEREVSYVP